VLFIITYRAYAFAVSRIGNKMPPADFRFDKTKADYWRGRSEEARVFAESMGYHEPKQSCSASRKNMK
jgi:hypothetical protein